MLTNKNEGYFIKNQKKQATLTTNLKILMISLIIVSAFFVILGFSIGGIYTKTTQADWDLGTYYNTTSNSTGVVFLNTTEYNFSIDDGNNVILLVHLNNDSAYFENNSLVYDFSNVKNNGTAQYGNGTKGFSPKANVTGKIERGFAFTDNSIINFSAYSGYVLGVSDFTVSAWIYYVEALVGGAGCAALAAAGTGCGRSECPTGPGPGRWRLQHGTPVGRVARPGGRAGALC